MKKLSLGPIPSPPMKPIPKRLLSACRQKKLQLRSLARSDTILSCSGEQAWLLMIPTTTPWKEKAESATLEKQKKIFVWSDRWINSEKEWSITEESPKIQNYWKPKCYQEFPITSNKNENLIILKWLPNSESTMQKISKSRDYMAPSFAKSMN